ncbi:MAG TPA: hypothetical protein VNC50_19680 [Planctomycetia bacterium]|nr:hypothetical protein [Planctomycetia bacterium]
MNRRHALETMFAAGFVAIARGADDEPDYLEKCRLPDGECVKRVPPPFPPTRLEYYRKESPGQAMAIPRGPDAMMLRYKDGKYKSWGMTFGSPYNLNQLLVEATGIFPQEVIGAEGLRKEPIAGDWVFRDGADAERKLEDLEHVLQTDVKLEVSMAFKEIERPVIVASGTYKFTPVKEGRKYLDLYGDVYDENSGAGGGSGKFAEFLKHAGEWISKPIVSEAEGTPDKEVSWRYHHKSRFAPGEVSRDHDQELVLRNLASQTGLEFKEGMRKIKALVVEDKRGK